MGLDSICEDDTIEEIDSAKEFKSCFGDTSSFKLSDFKGGQRVIVISNYYYGSNAARKESGVFAHTAQKLRDKFGNQVVFISSNKGADCRTWADEMATDALDYYPDSAEPDSMPLVVSLVFVQMQIKFYVFETELFIITALHLTLKYIFTVTCLL